MPQRVDRRQRVGTNVRLPPALHSALVEAAADREVSVNFLVTKAVERFLDRLIPVEEMRWTSDDGAR